jgi:Protein kinase domain
MALAAGTQLGAFQITALIGAGGMSEVYRARDTKLNRDVALKILPELFAIDPDRLARFKREAHLLASLNHPNIAGVHGFEDTGAVHALVLELVEGPTLADRIAHGPIPLDEALPIARQLAEALEAAHEQGIMRRTRNVGCATSARLESNWKVSRQVSQCHRILHHHVARESRFPHGAAWVASVFVGVLIAAAVAGWRRDVAVTW